MNREGAPAGCVRRWVAGVVAALALALLGGCYESEQEVIGIDRAERVAGLEGRYTNDKGTSTTISAVPYSNEYRYRQVTNKGEAYTGTLRAIALRPSVYVVQTKPDDEALYYLEFYEFHATSEGATFYVVEPDIDDAEWERLVDRHSVVVGMEEDSYLPRLEGEPAAVLAFLLDHRAYRFLRAEDL